MKAARRGHKTTGEAVPNTLPSYLTSFVGRDGELDALTSLLGHSRMVTLTGPGGAGKSRLAVELGHACLDRWPGGMWWVELAPMTDSRQMPGAVVAALELPGRGEARDVVTAWLAPRQALLVLDNCEHLVAACAEFCQAVLERCPQLTIIATSREPLGVAGEARWSVSSLAAPHAIELFEVRAQLALPDFKVVTSNLETVNEICRRLDGLPLAIELAAARVGMMAEQEILSQLSDRFHLLTGGNRTAPQRQQAMAATIDWSYRLLTEEEALLFRRLSVFRGGFTLESAQGVCADATTGSMLDLLAGLVQKSMVVAERSEGSSGRYRLLESQLAYAEDRLRQAGELELIRRRHYEYFSAGVSPRTTSYTGPRVAGPPLGFAEAQWIGHESGNLWAALAWARNHADDLGLRFAVDLARALLGDLAQLRSLLEELLDASPAKGLTRVYALASVSEVAYLQGDYDAAIEIAEAGIGLAHDCADAEAEALLLHWAASARISRMEFGLAAEMLERAIALLKGSDNNRLRIWIRNAMGYLAVQTGDYASAREIMSECLITTRAEGDATLTILCLEGLAEAQRGLGENQAASASWKEGLAISRDVRAQLGTIWCIDGLSMVAEIRRDDQRALRLAAAATRLADEISYKYDAWWLKQFDDARARSRARLGPKASDEAWNEGWAMTFDQAVDDALGESESESVIEAGPLSRRQKEVALLVAAGMTNRQIAQQLVIAERTAEGHVEQIRSRLGLRSRTEVAAWAVGHGLAVGPAGPDPNAIKKKRNS